VNAGVSIGRESDGRFMRHREELDAERIGQPAERGQSEIAGNAKGMANPLLVQVIKQEGADRVEQSFSWQACSSIDYRGENEMSHRGHREHGGNSIQFSHRFKGRFTRMKTHFKSQISNLK
jgi:hypothetical protein